MLRSVQPGSALAWTATLASLAALAGCGWGRPEPVRVYCYRTLADVACYDAPDRGRERQLVGVYWLGPDDPAWPAYQAKLDGSVVSR